MAFRTIPTEVVLFGSDGTAVDVSGGLGSSTAPPATATPVSGDTVISAVPTTYRGFSLRETSGTAAATVRIYDDGAAATGTILETIQLNPAESRSENTEVAAETGIYADVVSGAVEGSVRHG